MSILINGIECYVSRSGNFIDAVVRADTEADWVQGAVFYGLLEPTDDGNLIPTPGVDISVIGPMVLDPGDPDLGVAPTFDNRYHVNLRLSGRALEVTYPNGSLKWEQMAVSWSTFGDTDTRPNAQEQAKVLERVALINPDSIKTPLRVWA